MIIDRNALNGTMLILKDEYQNNFITSNDKCPSSKFEIYSEPNIKYLGN